MADFVVNTARLRSNADRLSALQRELNSVAVRLGAMQLGSILQIKASAALIGRVGDCKWAAAHQSDDLGKLSRGLNELAELYDKAEKALTMPKSQVLAQAYAEAVISGTASLADGSGAVGGWSLQDLVSWFGKKSVPFSVWAVANGFLSGDARGHASGLKNLTYAIGNGAKALFNADAKWPTKLRDFIGFKPNDVETLSGSWKKFLDDMNLGKQTTTAGKVATVCKWAGYALTFVQEGIDNYNEHGFTADFVAETAIEGTTYVGLSIGAGILAAAALPAATPAILVGAAAAGVVWLADTVVENLSDQDIGEWVSDAVYGVGEWVGDRVEDAGEWLGDRMEDAGKAIGKAADGVCSWVAGLFG